MDMTTIFPEGTDTISDKIVEDAKEFYNKDIITDDELEAFIEAKKLTSYWGNFE
jgi:hypothetical protein